MVHPGLHHTPGVGMLGSHLLLWMHSHYVVDSGGHSVVVKNSVDRDIRCCCSASIVIIHIIL